MKLTQWVKRRWYRSLLPIALGGLGFVALKYWLVDRVAHLGLLPVGVISGAVAGVLCACLTVAVTTICSMQTSCAVRSMLVIIACRFALLAHDDSMWVNASLLPESLFLIVGALLAGLLRPTDATHQLTGPGSRCLGTVNRKGDWLLLASLALYGSALMISRTELRAVNYLQEDAIISAIFAAVGFSMTRVNHYCLRNKSGWRMHLCVSFICTALFMLLLPTLGTRGLIPRLAWPNIHWFVVCSGICWYAMQYALIRWLARCGWRWNRKRESIKVLNNAQINFTATTRQRSLVAGQGWTSIAGVFVLLSVIALIPDVLDRLPSFPENRRRGFDFDAIRIAARIATEVLCVIATLGTVSVVTVTVVRGLWRQTMVCAVCFIGVGLSWSAIVDPESLGSNQDALIWATIAMPVILLARSMKSVSGKISGFDVGVSAAKPQPLAIRSIMMLTLLVGLQIVLIQSVEWESRLIAVILFTSLIGVFLAFVSVRRHLGKRTWTNLLSVTMATLGLIGTFTVVAYHEDSGPVAVFVLISLLMSWLYGAIWLSLGWLQHVGWTIQPKK